MVVLDDFCPVPGLFSSGLLSVVVPRHMDETVDNSDFPAPPLGGVEVGLGGVGGRATVLMGGVGGRWKLLLPLL